MDQPVSTTRRRRIAFSLRTLMAIVTVGAVAFWIYWSAWPRWQIYHEQSVVEAGARQLKVGSTAFEGMQILNRKRVATAHFSSTPPEHSILYGRVDYYWPSSIYCILYTYPDGYSGPMGSAPCKTVALYRVQPPGDRSLKRHAEGPLVVEAAENLDVYLRDFTHYVLIGNQSQPPPAEYELLYSDPPIKNR